MNEKIEKIKKELNDALNSGADWKPSYKELIKALYNEPVLFFALSKQEYDPKTQTSVPLISTKDFGGMPAIYVFSDVESASIWMNGYEHWTDDKTRGLIGAISKEPHSFLYVFEIAKGMGAEMIMLDEGGSYFGLKSEDFLRVNGLDINEIRMTLNEEELSDVLDNKEKPPLRFAPVMTIPLKY